MRDRLVADGVLAERLHATCANLHAPAVLSSDALAASLRAEPIIAAQLARPMGMLPWESALKLGPQHAWTLGSLANGPVDLAWLCAGLVIAAVLSR